MVLHIGTHKTATTMIQQKFWTNSPLLSERGVIYPRLDNNHGHHGLTAPWSPVEAVDPGFLLAGGAVEAFGALARRYAGEDVTVFLSSEEFSRSGPNNGVDYGELRGYLSDFDEVQVVCVLRPQWQFMQSVYVELSKVMAPPEPARFIITSQKKGVFAGLWGDYNLLLDRLEGAFGAENVTFLDYETCTEGVGGVVGAMLDVLGLDPTDDGLRDMCLGASNVSAPALACWVANQLTAPDVASDWLVDHAQRALKAEFGEPLSTCVFSRDEMYSLQKWCQPLNDKLQRRRQAVQPGFQMAPLAPTGVNLFREDVSAAFWLRMARIGFGLLMGRPEAEQGLSRPTFNTVQ
ncbi:hypothetical protein ACFORG_01675 [Lutimaribacter marinistellae]|uniref:Uncharacterized protein n=1 Tax=Lutimaribacter marinistellae TaxID=1820329 RepID=A0ABV7TB16_9RHOB